MKKLKKTSIPIKIFKVDDNGFHLSLTAKINGKKCNLIVDTGASRSVFDKKRIKDLQGDASVIPTEKLSTGIGNNQLKSELVKLNHLELGDLQIENYEAVIIDLSHVNSAYSQNGNRVIEGILGSDIMKKHKAIIDFDKKEIRLTFKTK